MTFYNFKKSDFVFSSIIKGEKDTSQFSFFKNHNIVCEILFIMDFIVAKKGFKMIYPDFKIILKPLYNDRIHEIIYFIFVVEPMSDVM